MELVDGEYLVALDGRGRRHCIHNNRDWRCSSQARAADFGSGDDETDGGRRATLQNKQMETSGREAAVVFD